MYNEVKVYHHFLFRQGGFPYSHGQYSHPGMGGMGGGMMKGEPPSPGISYDGPGGAGGAGGSGYGHGQSQHMYQVCCQSQSNITSHYISGRMRIATKTCKYRPKVFEAHVNYTLVLAYSVSCFFKGKKKENELEKRCPRRRCIYL